MQVAAQDDPVAAVLAAHREGRLLALRTSGTSGTARSVVRTTRSWFSSFDLVTSLLEMSSRSRVWVPGPLASTMNLFAAVHAADLGAAVVPKLEEATHAHLTPAALSQVCRGDDGALAGVHVLVAGDRLGADLHARATAAGARVSHYYGAAELSFVAWGSHEGDLRPLPQVEVEVRRGEIWAASPFLCDGYDGSPGPLRREGAWATVGDRGRLEDGYLRVLGRGEEAVTTAGATVLVADVEQALRQAARGDVVVLGLPHPELGQVLVAVLTEGDDFAGVRDRAGRLSAAHRPRVWFHVPDAPLTAAGKLDRTALREILVSPQGHTVRLT